MRLEPLVTLHLAFQLHYLLYFRTNRRRTLFEGDERMAFLSEWLTEICGRHEYHLLEAYWLRVAERRGFAIDRMSVLPDHVHLMLRTVPKMSIEVCALALMNNAQHWMVQRFAPVLVKEKVD